MRKSFYPKAEMPTVNEECNSSCEEDEVVDQERAAIKEVTREMLLVEVEAMAKAITLVGRFLLT